MLVDFHSHILPDVDDGARDVGEMVAALRTMYEGGVRVVIATPHFRASLAGRKGEGTEYRQRIEEALHQTRSIAAVEVPDLRIERGAEVLLDDVNASLSDSSLRLAGTQFALVEFSLYGAPPNARDLLFRLRAQGWQAILAHPERYLGLPIADLREWRTMGILLQLNAGSLLGDNGPEIRLRGWELLKHGLADYVCGDYHARGKYRLASALEAIEQRGGKRQRDALVENAVRLSRGEMPARVPPLQHPGWLKRLFGREVST